MTVTFGWAASILDGLDAGLTVSVTPTRKDDATAPAWAVIIALPLFFALTVTDAGANGSGIMAFVEAISATDASDVCHRSMPMFRRTLSLSYT